MVEFTPKRFMLDLDRIALRYLVPVDPYRITFHLKHHPTVSVVPEIHYAPDNLDRRAAQQVHDE